MGRSGGTSKALVNRTGGKVKKAQLGRLVKKGVQKGMSKAREYSDLFKGLGRGIREYHGKDAYGKDIITEPSNKVKDLFKGFGKGIREVKEPTKKYKRGGKVPNGPLIKKKGEFKGSTLKRGGKIKGNGKNKKG